MKIRTVTMRDQSGRYHEVHWPSDIAPILEAAGAMEDQLACWNTGRKAASGGCRCCSACEALRKFRAAVRAAEEEK